MHYLGAQSDCISQCPVRTQTMTCERRVHYVQVLVCNNESKTHVGRKKVSVDLQDSDTDVRVVAPAYGVKVTVPPVCKVFKDSFIHRSHVKKKPSDPVLTVPPQTGDRWAGPPCQGEEGTAGRPGARWCGSEGLRGGVMMPCDRTGLPDPQSGEKAR